jgi:hypothetical protein
LRPFALQPLEESERDVDGHIPVGVHADLRVRLVRLAAAGVQLLFIRYEDADVARTANVGLPRNCSNRPTWARPGTSQRWMPTFSLTHESRI